MNPSEIKIGLVQRPPVFLNKEKSVGLACEWIAEAKAKGADLLVFPETWLVGYPVWLDYAEQAALWDHPPAKDLFRILSEQAIALEDQATAQIQEKVNETGLIVVMGAHEKMGGTLYNSMFYFSPQAPVGVHRKLMPTYTERLIWGRGDGSTLHVMDTPFGRLGGLICWEHWMPLARAAMHAKQELIHVAQWPMVKEMNVVASRHYAFEGQCFTVASGCVLTQAQILEGLESLGDFMPQTYELLASMKPLEGGYLLRGGSALIAPSGDLVFGPIYDKADIFYGVIHPRETMEGRLFLDTDGHYARPDIFQLQIDERPQQRIVFKS